MEFKKDKYKQTRGGYSRMLDICCEKCGQHICYYQKDGPGILRRMYVDRMNPSFTEKNLICRNCKNLLGTKYTYEKRKPSCLPNVCWDCYQKSN